MESQGARKGEEIFSNHMRRARDEVRQNHAGQGKRPYPSNLARPAPLPSLATWRRLPW